MRISIKKILTILSISLVSYALLFAAAGEAASPAPLTDLRKTFLSKKERLLYGYLEQLVKLETNILTGGSSSGTAELAKEISLVEDEIKKLPNQSPALKPREMVTPKPVSDRVVTTSGPITHSSSVTGLAGAASFSENNEYSFELEKVGSKSLVKFWATGRRSTDSQGDVWLISPTGYREKIMKWRERDFTKPATEITSYEQIKPIIIDVSDEIGEPGNYRIEFEWTGGIDPLVIFRVELTS